MTRLYPPQRSAALLLALLLTACIGGGVRPVSDTPVKIGNPYRVKGVTYYPEQDPTYDMLGYASWYGRESGNISANGERFNARWITAAHRTLPLPTYAEVTALDTGRRILVRINDRGPFDENSRIIDLSKGAADLLGITRQGLARVRVQRVEPEKRDRDRLRRGQPARTLPPVSDRVLRNLRAQFDAARM